MAKTLFDEKGQMLKDAGRVQAELQEFLRPKIKEVMEREGINIREIHTHITWAMYDIVLDEVMGLPWDVTKNG